MTYMFFLIHLETCGYFSISAYVGLGTDEWVYDGTGTASVSSFLPRCVECRRGLAMRILSVRLSVCHTHEL